MKKINPYKYQEDPDQFKTDDVWLFPYELRKTGLGDCEDWAIELASYLIAAGVPNWRVRVVIGVTYNGGGHATVYILRDDLQTFTI